MTIENNPPQKQEKENNDTLELQFVPESDKKEFITATEEYREIWQEDGERMIRFLEDTTNLGFRNPRINVEIFEGISRAGVFTPPMKLRASYPQNIKRATLVHELSHHLLYDNGLGVELEVEGQELENHKRINLFLYDAWVDLYGTVFADRQVEVESGRVSFYREAWEWALGMTPEERAAELKSLVDTDS